MTTPDLAGAGPGAHAAPQAAAASASDIERQALAALRKMRERLDAAEAREAARQEPLAIVGAACRFPGAPDIDRFWELLCRGGDAIVDIPPERWSDETLARLGVAPSDIAGSNVRMPRKAGLLSGIEAFDAEFFGITGREAQLMDPQQRMFLEVAWEALERANIPPLALKGSRTGVFVGTTTSDYLHLLHQRLSGAEHDAYIVSGNTINASAGRVSYTLGLHGPAMAIDTACSSSLVAIDRACRSVREGESRLAIAGGVNLVLAPELMLSLARWGMLSPDARCKTFDASADGFVRAEGCGVVLVKRLADARADGDNIWALVRGSAVNQAGASGAFAVPNGLAQAEVLRSALAAARVSGAEVAYVEAHGTGTSLGDPIEMEGIVSVYGDKRAAAQPLWVGAVKSNVGHLEAAAGVTGLIKTVLALRHRQIPPNVHFENPTPHIPWAEIPVRVPTRVEAFPAIEGRRLAAVSAFGFSGTNAHVVLEEAPPAGASGGTDDGVAGRNGSDAGDAPPPLLLTLSARSAASLDALAARHADRLEAIATELHDPKDADAATRAYCLAASAGRSHLSLRLAVHASDAQQLASRLRAAAAAGDDQMAAAATTTATTADAVPGVARGRVGSDRPGITFLFTGQGAQYVGMGRRLAATSPVFRDALERCAAVIEPLLGRPLLPLIFGTDAGGDAGDVAAAAAWLNRTAITQPALFAIQYALCEWWRSVGVVPSLVLGHSVGEFAAACCAGVLTVEDAATLVTRRGALMQALPEGGTMAAVFAAENVVRERIAAVGTSVGQTDGVLVVAGINAPDETVVAGDAASVQALAAALRRDGVRVEALAVSHAFHSPLMEPMAERFAEAARGIVTAPAKMAVISSMTGKPAAADWGCADYWQRQLRAPVRWLDAMRSAALNSAEAAGSGIAIEIGPQPVLSGLGRRTLPEAGFTWLPTLRKGQDDAQAMAQALGEAYTRGGADDWSGAAGAAARGRVTLPVYPFRPTRHWVDERAGRAGHDAEHRADAQRSAFAVRNSAARCHPLLGAPLASAGSEAIFQADAGDARHAWLREHRIGAAAVWPAAASIEMLLAAARHAGLGHDVELRDIEFHAPLLLPGAGSVAVQTVLARSGVDVEDRSRRHAAHICRAPDAAGDSAHQAPASWPMLVSAQVGAAGAAANANHHASGDDAGDANGHARPPLDLQAARARCTEPVDAGAFHDGLARRGANFGPHFKRLLDARRGSDEAIARLAPPGAAGAASQAWMLHPALLDACLQLVSVAADGGTANANDDHLWIPARIGRVVWHASPAQPAWGHARLREAASTATLVADITAWSADATLLATLEAVQFMRASAAAISASAGVLPAHATPSLVERCALEWVWQPVDANAGAPADPPAAERASWCFVDDTGSRLGAALGQRLREHGATVVPAAAAGMPAAGATDIVLLAGPLLSRPFAPSAPDTIDDSAAIRRELDEATAVTASALSLVNRISVPPGGTPLRLWFVTRGAQAVRATESADARTATLWGLARVVRSERPELNCTAFDIDAACTADALVDALLRARRLDQRESQFALREGELLRSCLAPWPASAGAPLADRRFVAPRSGRLEDLRAEAVPAERLVPGPGEVCIDVRAAGLNFRDVLASIGMVASPVDALGGECAGRVVAVGAGVSGFVPGDEVFALALGGLATRVCVAQLYVVHRPSGVSPVQAAALPIACLTASYGLERLAGLKRGQRVLIHAATGGVGMAAVQLAQHLGAEVYATAGSQTKRDHLRSLGIRHVFDSRSLDFAREIREATGGAGVHVVLNALAGEFIEAGLALLSPGGCFLEMGKRGVWSSTQVAERFPSLRYHVFDLGDAAAADEALAPALFARLLARLAAGELTPLPVRTFPMREARAAFEQMAHARHIGKLVLVRDDSAPPLRCEVRADASYLVTGGFGALGLQVAEALVARGARHLVLLGRRPPGEAAKTVLDRLAARGVSIHPLFIDLSEVGAAEALAARWSALAARPPAHPTALPPLRGIVHCAGVIDDAVLARQDAGRVAKVLAPKLAGALALAAAAAQPDLEIELDFFVLFGAGAAWLGNAGQANYAAANTALDALAQTLRAQGRPATAIAWGRWQGAGMASAASGSAAWAALGIGEIAGAEGTAAMFECIERQAASVALLPMDWPTWLGKAFGDASRAPAAYDVVARRALAGSAAAQSSTKAAAARKPGALARLQAQPPHERREALQKVLEVQVRQVAGLASSQAIDPTWPLRELGLDSLMSVELRNALGGRFERSLSATLVFDHPTLNALTDYLMRTLPGLLEADTAAEAAAHTPDATRLAAAPIATARRAAETEALQALSDEQAEARLLAELSQGTGR